MDIEQVLEAEAEYLVANLEGRRPALEAELREIERRKLQVNAELEATHIARHRLVNFRPRFGADYQCPRCWVHHETRSRLESVGSDTRDDILRCRQCGADVVIPSG